MIIVVLNREEEENMGNICITRKKHFAGCLMDYYCILGIESNNLEELLECIYQEREDHAGTDRDWIRIIKNTARVITIKNGETISINVSESENNLVILAFSTPQFAVSNQLQIEPVYTNQRYLINTIYSFKKGIHLQLT